MTRKAGSVGDGGSFVPSHDDGKPRIEGKVVRVWSGIVAVCDVCKVDLMVGKSFTDGATVMGPWANMCEGCYRNLGVGLGVGRGQRYEVRRLDSGSLAWVKVQG